MQIRRANGNPLACIGQNEAKFEAKCDEARREMPACLPVERSDTLWNAS